MKKKWDNGFTLVELMMVIALISIVGFFGAPQINQAKRNYTFSNDMRQMRAAISRARLEALKLGTVTSVAFTVNSPPGALPVVLPSYVAFVDTNRDGILDAGETVIHQGRFHSGITMSPPIFSNNGLNDGNSMQFNPLGFPSGIDAAGILTDYSGRIDANLIDNSKYQRLTIAPNGSLSIISSQTPIP